MSEDWCIEQLAKLQIKERRLDTLNEIRTQLTNVGPNETSISAKFLALLDSIDDYRDRYKNYHEVISVNVLFKIQKTFSSFS